MKDSVKNLPRSTLDRASANVHEIVDDTASAIAPAANWVSDRIAEASESGSNAVGQSSHYISKNPIKSVAIAVAAGFLIAKIVR